MLYYYAIWFPLFVHVNTVVVIRLQTEPAFNLCASPNTHVIPHTPNLALESQQIDTNVNPSAANSMPALSTNCLRGWPLISSLL